MTHSHEFSFPIEAGHVLGFRRAVGEPDEPLVVPPTFTAVADHFDPRFDRRPPRGRGWAATEVESHLHVEQHFTYRRPVVAGETFQVRRGPGRRWSKQGRSGHLEFVEHRTELFDPNGEGVVDIGWVDVHTGTPHVNLTNDQRAPEARGDNGGGRSRSGSGRVVVDMTVATEISRTQITMYVGASGDFHPLHHDENYAVAHGYPSVFVPGMLTMALTARALAHVPGSLRTFGGRFRAQVWPGDSMQTKVATIAGSDHAGHEIAGSENARYDIATTNQRGDAVFTGYATFDGS